MEVSPLAPHKRAIGNLHRIVLRISAASMARLGLGLILVLTLNACSMHRKSVPPGVIPRQEAVSEADELYGHEVFAAFTQRFTLDQDDNHVNRVRDIADRLSTAAKADQNPWHVHVFREDTVKNAAATRGNYIFVWTGILNVVQNDTELATILAHEMGHVLARHSDPSPQEEAGRVLSSIIGMATGIAVSSRAGAQGLGDLAGNAVQGVLEGVLVNPVSQEKELEADLIGLFLMADAGYDPRDAVQFWARVKANPDFQDSPLQFISTHPSNEARIAQLQQFLPAAIERYENSRQGSRTKGRRDRSSNSYEVIFPDGQPPTRSPTKQTTPERGNHDSFVVHSPNDASTAPSIWVVEEEELPVYDQPSKGGTVVHRLTYLTEVEVAQRSGIWFEISSPVQGYVEAKYLAAR